MRVALLASIAVAGLTGRAAADVSQAPETPGEDGRPAVAIGPIALSGSGEVPPQFADKLRNELETALAGTETRLVAPDAVAAILTTMPDLATCATPACLQRLAMATAAQRLVVTRMTVSGQLFDIAVDLVDDQGRRLRQRTARCVACTLNDALTRTAQAATALATADDDDAVPVTIKAVPREATISIDDQDRGEAPFAGTLTAGAHRIVVSGERRITRDVFLEAGASLQLSIDAGNPGRPAWITYAAAGAGATALIAGVSLLAIDGNGTCDAPGTCPRVRETSTAGGLMVVLGVAGLGTAGWLWWRGHQGERAATVVPTDGGAAAVFAGRF